MFVIYNNIWECAMGLVALFL